MLCRICVSEETKFICLVNLLYGNVPASSFIKEVLKIDVHENPLKNQSLLVICDSCHQTIKDFYKFYRKVSEAQHFYSQLSNIKQECQTDPIKTDAEPTAGHQGNIKVKKILIPIASSSSILEKLLTSKDKDKFNLKGLLTSNDKAIANSIKVITSNNKETLNLKRLLASNDKVNSIRVITPNDKEKLNLKGVGNIQTLRNNRKVNSVRVTTSKDVGKLNTKRLLSTNNKEKVNSKQLPTSNAKEKLVLKGIITSNDNEKVNSIRVITCNDQERLNLKELLSSKGKKRMILKRLHTSNEKKNLNLKQNALAVSNSNGCATSKDVESSAFKHQVPLVDGMENFFNDESSESSDEWDNEREKTISESQLKKESQSYFSHKEREGKISRSEFATKKMFAKYKKEEIFHKREWVLSEKQRDEMLSLYVDFKCRLCKVAPFFKYKNLYEHSIKQHQEIPKLKCCRYNMRNREQTEIHILYRHILKKTPPHAPRYATIKCHICHRTFSTQSFKLHLSTHLPHDKRKYQCDHCHIGFGAKSALSCHIVRNHSESHVACNECGKVCLNKFVLQQHKKIHDPSNICLCPECGKRLKNSSTLAYHLTLHRDVKEKVKCRVCDTVIVKHSIRAHMRRHDENNKKQCPHCPYSSFNISQHIKRVHEKVKLYNCNMCSAKFASSTARDGHMAAKHTGIPLHSCEFCEKTFMSNGNYYTHRKRMHPKQMALQKSKLKMNDANVSVATDALLKRGKRREYIQGAEAEDLIKTLDEHQWFRWNNYVSTQTTSEVTTENSNADVS